MTRLFGGLLIAIGILVMTSTGLCSLYVIIAGFVAAMREPELFLFPLIFGGVPFVIGLGLYRWGRWLLRRAEADIGDS